MSAVDTPVGWRSIEAALILVQSIELDESGTPIAYVVTTSENCDEARWSPREFARQIAASAGGSPPENMSAQNLDDADLGMLPVSPADLAVAYRRGIRHGQERVAAAAPVGAETVGDVERTIRAAVHHHGTLNDFLGGATTTAVAREIVERHLATPAPAETAILPSTRERAEEVVLDTLRTAETRSQTLLASDVLDDLHSAGFRLVEGWLPGERDEPAPARAGAHEDEGEEATPSVGATCSNLGAATPSPSATDGQDESGQR